MGRKCDSTNLLLRATHGERLRVDAWYPLAGDLDVRARRLADMLYRRAALTNHLAGSLLVELRRVLRARCAIGGSATDARTLVRRGKEPID